MRLSPGVPVLALPHGGVRVGVHRAVIFDAPTDAERMWLEQLERPHVGSSQPQLTTPSTVPTRLAAAGLTGEPPAPCQPTVRVRGPQRVGGVIAEILTRTGIEATAATTSGEQHPLARATVTYGAHDHPSGTLARHARADVEILVTFASPSPVAVDLLSADQPHVFLLADEAGVTVGPVVVPGTTACGTCLGLHKTDTDPSWPWVALQCEGRIPHIRADLLAEVAGLAGRLARCATDPAAAREAPVWRVEPDGLTSASAPAPHPDCGCMHA